MRAVLAKKVLNHESFHADVKLLVLSVVFMPAVIGGLVISASAVSASVNHLLAGLFGSRAPVEGGDLTLKIVSTIILFLAYEIGYWVDHYLKHRVPFLWELHKLHHTADVLTPLTNFRNHPIDNIVFGYMLAIFIGGASGLLGWLYGRNPETFDRRKKHSFPLLPLDHRPSAAFGVLDSVSRRLGTDHPVPRSSSDSSL
jgi:sterol desaturase/sphingolipid hydroxylase (fatty acid hydroxylase superfamily)